MAVTIISNITMTEDHSIVTAHVKSACVNSDLPLQLADLLEYKTGSDDTKSFNGRTDISGTACRAEEQSCIGNFAKAMEDPSFTPVLPLGDDWVPSVTVKDISLLERNQDFQRFGSDDAGEYHWPGRTATHSPRRHGVRDCTVNDDFLDPILVFTATPNKSWLLDIIILHDG
jgi:hypothetical protein